MKKKYDIIEVMTLAIAVDENQGFIKSGYGYYDVKKETNVYDNKTTIKNILNETENASDITITDSHREQAQELKEYFDSVIVMKKLTGSVNGFEDTVGQLLNHNEVDNYGVSVIASLPNSLRIQKQRDEMEEFYDKMRISSQYVGTVGKRFKFELLIQDIKFIAKYNIHLVTGVEGEQNLVKFFWSKDPDISSILVGKKMSVTGFIKEQSISKFSKCKETVINRVKIQESA
jgi:hypothetical protein